MVRRHRQSPKPDPDLETVKGLKRRDELRDEFYERLPKPDKFGVRGEAVLQDIKRLNSYPRLDNRRKEPFAGSRLKSEGCTIRD